MNERIKELANYDKSKTLSEQTSQIVEELPYTEPKTTPAAQTDDAKKQTPSQPVAVTDQNLIKSLTFEYTYPGDNIYIYAKSNGKWYGKNNKNNKIFDISKNYPAVAKNLDTKAVVKKAESDEVPQPPELPTTPPPISSNDNAIEPPQEK